MLQADINLNLVLMMGVRPLSKSHRVHTKASGHPPGAHRLFVVK